MIFLKPPLFLSPRPALQGVDAFMHKVAGYWKQFYVPKSKMSFLAKQCCRDAKKLSHLSDSDFKQRLKSQKALYKSYRNASQLQTCEALSYVLEASKRSMGLSPYQVQVMGALVLNNGYLAEMATGEGKTLTVALAGVLAAWSGEACHLLTANDYLATRDAQIMTPLYHYCDVRVASICEKTDHNLRSEIYQADVVYLTAKELLADYLRDACAIRNGYATRNIMFKYWQKKNNQHAFSNACWSPLILSKGIHTVIVDEIDSLLIDEAVTPLILSLPIKDEELNKAIATISNIAETLKEEDYKKNIVNKTVELLTPAKEKLNKQQHLLPKVWKIKSRREELLRQALIARHFFICDKQYVIEDGKLVLIDESTGRKTPNRTLASGLHQACEAKENLSITDQTESIAQMSFQIFFRHFKRLSGTSGTAKESSREFWRVYNLITLAIPPNVPSKRKVYENQIYLNKDEKLRAVIKEIKKRHQQRQPVLIGVKSVKASDELATLLKKEELIFSQLNAVNELQEADIIAKAGQLGSITIATNMAGRGTDIKLPKESQEVGGLHVIISEFNDSGRIDRQLAGRCARQGEKGSAITFLSADDDLIKQNIPSFMQKAFKGFLTRNFLFKWAQRSSEKKAEINRKQVMKNDEWLNRSLPF